jgi:hypothetical protein
MYLTKISEGMFLKKLLSIQLIHILISYIHNYLHMYIHFSSFVFYKRQSLVFTFLICGLIKSSICDRKTNSFSVIIGYFL